MKESSWSMNKVGGLIEREMRRHGGGGREIAIVVSWKEPEVA